MILPSMETSIVKPLFRTPKFEPDTEKIKRNLPKHGVYPTHKIIHSLSKKEIQKHNRKSKSSTEPALSDSQKHSLAEEVQFQTLKREYKACNVVKAKTGNNGGALMVGVPWEMIDKVRVKELSSKSKERGGERLKRQELMELSKMFEERKRDELKWVLDDDIETDDGWLDSDRDKAKLVKKKHGEDDTISFLLERLSAREITKKDWKFDRMMKKSGLSFTEVQLLKIIEGLGSRGQWKQAISVVEWVYDDKDKESKHWKSRFVYTKLLAVLGKARRPQEALQIFNLMLGDCHIYPDMAAYRSISVTLGQAGLLKELLNIIECVKQKPSKKTRNVHRKNWDPTLTADVVVYNAVLNACVPSNQWKGVFWVFQQLRKSGLKPNGASYGLAMEVMLQSGKYDLVHEFFRKMRKIGEAPKALTYKVLVKTFWEEGKVDKAVEAVRDMEQRGVVGTAGVYYELACCLCKKGRWRDSIIEVEKMKRLPLTKPLAVTFTGMIMSAMDGGHIDGCISIFELMKDHCSPNIGTINAMLKVYSRNDMFGEAKDLFEDIRSANSGSISSLDDGECSLIPDEYTYRSMLEVSASAQQWEYFEYVYREMNLAGYQFDESKNPSLLLEASRAGKCHLLEHATDIILEDGEIPPPLFFSEMVLQAIAQQNFGRAVTWINTMAHAPFQVSEREWIDLFEDNRDRISQEKLENLRDALCDCDVASEPTVSNLSRSLYFLCGSGAPGNISCSIHYGNKTLETSSVDDCNGKVDDNESANMQNANANVMSGNPNPEKHSLGINFLDIDFINQTTVEASATETEVVSGEPAYVKVNGRTNIYTEVDAYDSDMDELSTYILNRYPSDWDEGGVEMPMKEVDDSCALDLPSANEILDIWKEARKKDGKLFPFQLYQK